MPTIGMMMSLTNDDDDAAEGRTDDDADGEVDDIALHGEIAEFLQHPHPLLFNIAHGSTQSRLS